MDHGIVTPPQTVDRECTDKPDEQKPSASDAPDTLHQPPSALLFLEYVSKRWAVAVGHKSQKNGMKCPFHINAHQNNCLCKQEVLLCFRDGAKPKIIDTVRSFAYGIFHR